MEIATCRGCGRKLKGKPYHMGGPAYHPDQGGIIRVCHYGGYVCSRACDIRACIELESSMPRCHTVSEYRQLTGASKARINQNWPQF